MPRVRDATPALVPVGVRVPATVRRYVAQLHRMRAGNQVTLLRAGAETYPAMLEAIAGAQRQILLETYILEQDLTGNRFAAALRERALAGVSVKLIFDSVGGLGLSSDWLDALAHDGVEIVEYHPIAPWRRRWNLSRRDHRKILVVDGQVGFTGGINIADDYASVADGGRGWHDLHCKVAGPAALDLARLFRSTWVNNGGADFPSPPRPEDAPPAGGQLVRILANGRVRRRTEIRRAYLHAINAARETVLIENAYFLPDRSLRRALRRAVDRGVAILVIVPGQTDIKTVEYAGLYAHRALARVGIPIVRWTGVMLHSKAAVIDRVWSAIGSYNLDARSLLYNLEVVAEVLDAALGEIVHAQLALDAASSQPFDERAWTQLPWWKKALAWFAYQLRDWL